MRKRLRARWLLVAVLPILLLVVLFAVRGPASPPPASATVPAAPVIDGITCDPAGHGHRISVRLTILTNGHARDIMANVGAVNALVAFPSGGPVVTRADCYYWLHTGKDDGVIHVDPPASVTRSFTLGDFFDVWHEPLGTNAVASDEGRVVGYINGSRYQGSPRGIPLTDNAVIQLDVTR